MKTTHYFAILFLTLAGQTRAEFEYTSNVEELGQALGLQKNKTRTIKGKTLENLNCSISLSISEFGPNRITFVANAGDTRNFPAFQLYHSAHFAADPNCVDCSAPFELVATVVSSNPEHGINILKASTSYTYPSGIDGNPGPETREGIFEAVLKDGQISSVKVIESAKSVSCIFNR